MENYSKLLEKAKKVYKTCTTDAERKVIESIFPDVKESDDERIRKELLDYLEERRVVERLTDIRVKEEWIAWLEKQGGIDLEHYEDSENEKRKFVGYGFLKCKGDFLSFKEGKTYWLEYVGKDNYNVRSDNLLGQTFYIKPVELYTVFRPTTWLEKQGEQQHTNSKEDDTNEETNAPTEYGKYVDECLNEASKHFFSDGEDKYSVADLFYAGVRCGKSWFEKQDDKDKLIKELGEYKVKYTQEVLENHMNNVSNKDDERLRKTTIGFLKEFADKGYENAVECIDWLEKQKEHKSVWSEDDEAILKAIIQDIQERHHDAMWGIDTSKTASVSTEFIIKFLKSLSPQSHWKPSEEQINALEHFVRSIGESGYASPYDNNTKLVYSLFNDLKKL